MNYADLQVTTHFSFLRGASSPEELFANAAMLGIKALGIVDRNSLAGIVRAFEAAKTTGVRLIVGCRLDLQCGTSLLVYPTDREAHGRLCRLLTIGKTRAGKGQCHLDWPDVEAWHEGLLAVLLPDDLTRELPGELIRQRRIFGDRAVTPTSGGTSCDQWGERGYPLHALFETAFKILCGNAQRRIAAGLARGRGDKIA
jgi:error-prone DNA polymerase